MAPDGTGVVRVTSFSGLEATPAWSPDNKRIVFSRMRPDASNVMHRDVYLMNADGTGKRWIESQPSSVNIEQPAWSPDGTRLVVVVTLSGIPRLMLMNVATGAVSFIIGPQGAASGFFPSFDPTGKKIVYVGVNYESIEVVNVDGTGHTVIMAGAPYEFHWTRYSPDGKRIAFARKVAGNLDIYVRTLSTGAVKRLTFHSAEDTAPTWSPDGSRIAFSSFRAGPSQIYTVSSAGGTQTRITHTTTQEAEPAWSH
jgi:Tol biopolymer transport system component